MDGGRQAAGAFYSGMRPAFMSCKILQKYYKNRPEFYRKNTAFLPNRKECPLNGCIPAQLMIPCTRTTGNRISILYSHFRNFAESAATVQFV